MRNRNFSRLLVISIVFFTFLSSCSISVNVSDLKVLNFLQKSEIEKLRLHELNYGNQKYFLVFIDDKPLLALVENNNEYYHIENKDTLLELSRLYYLENIYYSLSEKEALKAQLMKFNFSLYQPYDYKYLSFHAKNPLYDCPESFDLKRENNYSPCNDLEACKSYFIVYCMQRGCDAGLYASSMFRYITYIDLLEQNITLLHNSLDSLQNSTNLFPNAKQSLIIAQSVNKSIDILMRNRLRLPDAKVPLDECPNCAGVCSIIPADINSLNFIINYLRNISEFEEKAELMVNYLELGLIRAKNYEKEILKEKLSNDYSSFERSLNISNIVKGCDYLNMRIEDNSLKNECNLLENLRAKVSLNINNADKESYVVEISQLRKLTDFLSNKLSNYTEIVKDFDDKIIKFNSEKFVKIAMVKAEYSEPFYDEFVYSIENLNNKIFVNNSIKKLTLNEIKNYTEYVDSIDFKSIYETEKLKQSLLAKIIVIFVIKLVLIISYFRAEYFLDKLQISKKHLNSFRNLVFILIFINLYILFYFSFKLYRILEITDL